MADLVTRAGCAFMAVTGRRVEELDREVLDVVPFARGPRSSRPVAPRLQSAGPRDTRRAPTRRHRRGPRRDPVGSRAQRNIVTVAFAITRGSFS